MTVFVVHVINNKTKDSNVSQLGFNNLKKAREWVEDRADSPAKETAIRYVSPFNTYLIKEITIW